ncbi:AraC family transcriptional regulator [Clostridium transplantifaecale]|uniref:AraC family transcriptional regulator n=1 Tax=Clostridium transplantifaecale TaxID=2479838 RepID=UPI000F643BDA|nr:AraC family transcriptional regulator [Clostridium transplantifaecale]
MNNGIIVDENQKANFSLPCDFPIRVYETNLQEKPYGYNGWHWHDEFQLCVVQEGAICMTVQKKEYLLETGEGIFINAGLLHMTHPIQGHNARYLCINIHPVMFSFFRGSLLEQKYFLPYIQNGGFFAVPLKPDAEWQLEVLKRQNILSGLMEKQEPGYELEVYIHLISIWKDLVLNADVSGQVEFSVFRHEEIKEIITYIQQHYAGHISLQDIASSLHISKSGCCRLFKQALNCTILDYLTEYRIQKSLTLLTGTDKSVTQIAYDVGFSCVSYYIKKFNLTMHMTPGAYRKMKQPVSRKAHNA